MTTTADKTKIVAATPPHRRSISDLLAPLEKIALDSPNLVADHGAHFETAGQRYELPRYLFIGPKGGNTPIRLGIFAGIHGDELEGALATVLFIQLLEAKPELAAGYCLFFYPVCNPTGFEDATRFSRNGKDLNREFWKNSAGAEVQLLQSEIISHAFDGIISLRANGTKNYFHAVERGETLTRHLIAPALRAVEKFSQDYDRPVFHSHGKASRDDAEGILGAPPDLRPRPFEIILETAETRAAWLMVALLSILEEYKKFIAYAPNL